MREMCSDISVVYLRILDEPNFGELPQSKANFLPAMLKQGIVDQKNGGSKDLTFKKLRILDTSDPRRQDPRNLSGREAILRVICGKL